MTTQNQLLREALHDIEQAHDLSLDLDHYAARQVLVSLADKIKVALAAQPAEGQPPEGFVSGQTYKQLFELNEKNAERILALEDELDALKSAQPADGGEDDGNPLSKRCYTMSESHLSGYRLIVGFESLGDAQAAHSWVANIGRPTPPSSKPAEGGDVVFVPPNVDIAEAKRVYAALRGSRVNYDVEQQAAEILWNFITLYLTPPASQEQTDLRLVTFVREVALGAYMSVEAMLRAKELLHQIDGACQSRSAKSDQQAGLMLTDATQASQEQSDAATTAGMQSAMGNLSRLVDEATVLLSQLRTMVDDMHEQWSIGGVPERGEFPLLDRVDDWLSARPSQEQAQQPSVTVRYDLSPAMVEGAIRDRLIAMGWTPPLQQPKPQPLPDGWVPLTIEHEPGYPEDVAFGPQRMMDRLKKWLDRYFEMLNQPKPQPITVDEVAERLAEFPLLRGIASVDIHELMFLIRMVEAHHGITIDKEA